VTINTLWVAPNHFNLEGYQIVDPEELFEIMKNAHRLLMQCHIDEQKITPITLIGKVIIKWKK
jgi:hypothetical protein